MPDYKAMYFELFRAMNKAMEDIKAAMVRAEEIYISDKTVVLQIAENEETAQTN